MRTLLPAVLVVVGAPGQASPGHQPPVTPVRPGVVLEDAMPVVVARVAQDTHRGPVLGEPTHIAASVKTLFRQFRETRAVRAGGDCGGGGDELPAHGPAEGRAAFAHALEGVLDRLPPAQGQQLIAACLAIYSAPFWQMLRAALTTSRWRSACCRGIAAGTGLPANRVHSCR